MSKALILVAEDDLDTRDTLRQLLETAGYDVVGAEDSILAYGLLQKKPPDVLLIDIMMPLIDGIGFIRWVRNTPRFVRTPIVAMTAYDERYLREAKEAGANLTLRKPGDIPDVAQIIERALVRSRQYRRTELTSPGRTA